jgi:hypothetical protein
MVRSERQRALKEFTVFVRTVHEGAIPLEWSDEEVQKCAFTKDRVVDLVLGYMKAVVDNPTINVGRLGDHFKINTLRKRKEHIWFFACWALKK